MLDTSVRVPELIPVLLGSQAAGDRSHKLGDGLFIHSFIYLLIKVYKIHKCNKRQVKPSRTARLTRALTAALKIIKTVLKKIRSTLWINSNSELILKS